MKTIKKNNATTIFLLVTLVLFSSCMKEFLDVKRDKSQVIPISLIDYYSLFENNRLNYFTSHLLGEISSDDYFVQFDQWQGLSNPEHKNGYIWADEIYEGGASADWNHGYEKILYANFVLEGVANIEETPANKRLRNEIIGAGHFIRGSTFFQLAQLFCKQYDPATANFDLGLPLRTVSNINVKYQRASLEQTYNLIISDLEKSEQLLPSEMSLNTRPYRAAALGMLANVYLQIGEYEAARQYSDMAISLAPEILDYNELNTAPNLTFPQFGRTNQEIVYYSHISGTSILATSRLNVDTLLFDSYHENDLRKVAFFLVTGGRTTFKGSYAGSVSFLFTGLTTPELFLIRAECNTRLGNSNGAVSDLNTLLAKRFRPEQFQPIEGDLSTEELLEIVLSERRKELVYRGRRWHDLKRFSKDPHLATHLSRVLNGIEHNLPINSPKWVLPIPSDAISLGGLDQNER